METLRMDQTQWWNNHEGKASTTATPFVRHDVISSYQSHSIVTYSAMIPHGTQLLHGGKQANASILMIFKKSFSYKLFLLISTSWTYMYRYKRCCFLLFGAEKVEKLSLHLMWIPMCCLNHCTDNHPFSQMFEMHRQSVYMCWLCSNISTCAL